MLSIFLICLLFGCISGFLAGLLGLGGGLVLVPFFWVIFESQGITHDLLMIMSIATSLATIILTSTVALLTQQQLKTIIWPTVFHLSIGIIVGVLLGVSLVKYLSSDHLVMIFACYMLYMAVRMVIPRSSIVKEKELSTFRLKIAGLIIGCISAILGIGGGTLTVPLLSKHQLPMRNAVAISSACGLPIAIMGTISYALLGWNQSELPIGSLGYVYLPAFLGIVISSLLVTPYGAKLAYKLPTKTLKRYFSYVLFFVAGKLFWSIF